VKSRKAGGGRVRVTLDADEAELLQGWLGQLADLVAPERTDTADPLVAVVGLVGSDESVQRPDDEALQRLFPDAYRDDEAEAEQFRRFTEQDLRAGKEQCARRVLDSLAGRDEKGRIELSPQQARDWLRSLNDLRLVIGTRLGIADEDDAWPDEDDPRGAALLAYHWLTHVQGTLVEAVEPGQA
jgi:hypothetical protein